MEIVGVGLLVALIWKLVDWLKQGLAGDRNGFITQLVVYVVAIAVAFGASVADLTDRIPLVGDVPLGDLNAASLILAGLLIGSGASGFNDIKQAIDGTDSAAKPPLTGLARSGPRTP